MDLTSIFLARVSLFPPFYRKRLLNGRSSLHIIEDTNAIRLAYTYPRNHLCNFFEWVPGTSGSAMYTSLECDHLIFTLGHRIDNMKLRDILFCNFTVYKKLRHHANDFCLLHSSRQSQPLPLVQYFHHHRQACGFVLPSTSLDSLCFHIKCRAIALACRTINCNIHTFSFKERGVISYALHSFLFKCCYNFVSNIFRTDHTCCLLLGTKKSTSFPSTVTVV